MSSAPDAIEQQRLQTGVFQPGRAEIAREMECRLKLCEDEAPDAPQQRGNRQRD